MKRPIKIGVAVVFVLAVVGAGLYFALFFSVSALQTPNVIEYVLATEAKHYLLERDARDLTSPLTEVQGTNGAARGKQLFHRCCRGCGDKMCLLLGPNSGCADMCFPSCAMCHGKDGREPTLLGRSLFPAAPDLGSPDVQRYSDGALFLVIERGIRLSGMPGFKNFFSESEICDLVSYVRSLGDGWDPPRYTTQEVCK